MPFSILSSQSITVCQNINTGFGMGYLERFGITAPSDGTVVVYGRENKQYKLKRFSLETGRELSSAGLAEEPFDMTEVQLGGRSTVAVSYACVNLQ